MIPMKLSDREIQSNNYKVATVKPVLFSRSPVDIIIPMHGQYDKVTRLIQSIIQVTHSNPYQITVVDDASPNDKFINDFKDFDEKRPEGTEAILKFIRSEKQLGFGGACYLGYQNTKQPWCLFIHTDCVIEHPNWMIELGKSLLELKSQGVRMVSSRNNLTYAGCPTAIRGNRNDEIKDVILDENSFLPLFCFMCHRELFNHIGGFIKSYPYGMYEDEELAYRMNHFKFKQAICGKSWVYHEGSATFNSLINKNPEIEGIINLNRDRCILDIRSLINR